MKRFQDEYKIRYDTFQNELRENELFSRYIFFFTYIIN